MEVFNSRCPARAAGNQIIPLSAPIGVATVKFDDAIRDQEQKIWFNTPVDPAFLICITSGDESFEDTGNSFYCVGVSDFTTQYVIASWVDSELTPTPMESAKFMGELISMWQQNVPYNNNQLDRGHKVTGRGVGYITIENTTDNTGAPTDPIPRWAVFIAFSTEIVQNAQCWSRALGTSVAALPVALPFKPSINFANVINTTTAITAFKTRDDGPAGLCAENEAAISMGWGIDDGADSQGSFGLSASDQVAAPVDQTLTISNTKALSMTGFNPAALPWSITMDNYSASGFDLTPSAPAENAIAYGIAAEFVEGFTVKQGNVTIPGSGDYVQSGLGHYPVLGMIMGLLGTTSYDSIVTATNMCHYITLLMKGYIVGQCNSSTSGGNDLDFAGRATMGYRMLAYFGVPTPKIQQVNSTGHSFAWGGWTVTLDDYPDDLEENRGICLSFGT